MVVECECCGSGYMTNGGMCVHCGNPFVSRYKPLTYAEKRRREYEEKRCEDLAELECERDEERREVEEL